MCFYQLEEEGDGGIDGQGEVGVGEMMKEKGLNISHRLRSDSI